MEETKTLNARNVSDSWLRAFQPVPRCLNGETVWVIGGGPSLRNHDPSALKDEEVVVTNEAFALYPTALALVFVDVGWWQRRKSAIRNTWKGRFIIGRGNYRKIYAGDGVLNVAYRSGMEWSANNRILGGKNSGLAALNCAWLMGASRAILLGFDMKPTDGRNNYHALHPVSGKPNYTHRYVSLFIPEMERAAKRTEDLGFVVINATPDSALTCFPSRPYDWCLENFRSGNGQSTDLAGGT